MYFHKILLHNVKLALKDLRSIQHELMFNVVLLFGQASTYLHYVISVPVVCHWEDTINDTKSVHFYRHFERKGHHKFQQYSAIYYWFVFREVHLQKSFAYFHVLLFEWHWYRPTIRIGTMDLHVEARQRKDS